MSYQKRIYYLLDQAKLGRITEEECLEVERMLSSDFPDREAVYAILDTYYAAQQLQTNVDAASEEWKRIARGILTVDRPDGGAVTDTVQQFKQVAILRTTWLRYAAAVLFLFCVGAAVIWTIRSGKNSDQLTATGNIPVSKELHGGNKAVLTLADGSSILLNTVKEGVFKEDAGVRLQKTADNRINYLNIAEGNQGKGVHILTTPKGSQYQLSLSDGTKVWLNAESSIQYPAQFGQGNREVKISGEVYLEVASKKLSPFIVETEYGTRLEVIGTSFNLNAYTEGLVKTTLLEGAVIVHYKGEHAMLKPGESAISAAKLTRKPDENIEQIMAWKNGYFNFTNTTLKEVMIQLTRWYDIEIKYETKIPDKKFGGEISLDLSLEQVVNLLNGSNIKCRLEGKTLIIE